jgi:pimeloyl-ACP methyl ester carboxylesterase
MVTSKIQGVAAIRTLLILSVLTLMGQTAFCSEPDDPVYVSSDFCVETADGVLITGTRYSGDNDTAIIYCHSLLGNRHGPEVERLLESFIAVYDLITFDFRGHRSSYGITTTGGDEILDLHAVIAFAVRHRYRRIVVLGAGMGATVGLRAAETFGNIDALIAVSPSGFSPVLSPFVVGFISDKTLGTRFGRVPLRLITKTRLGLRYSAGYPVDMLPPTGDTPLLIVHAKQDRLVSLRQLEILLEDLTGPDQIIIRPGRKHAEDLIDDDTVMRIQEFLRDTFASVPSGPVARPSDGVLLNLQSCDPAQIVLGGDVPLPESVVRDELHKRLNTPGPAATGSGFGPESVLHHLREALAFHGYTRASVSPVDSGPQPAVRISIPRIDSVHVHGNKWVGEGYTRHLLRIGHGYFNAYELDAAARRVASEPAIRTVRTGIAEITDSTVVVDVKVIEESSYRIMLATKFTDIDDFIGLGLKWNEFNPTGFQYEARAMLGIRDYDFLTYHRLSKNLVSRTLKLHVAGFDNIKSRDDLDYVFSRQEVHELGGELGAQYMVSSNLALEAGVFAKRYKSPTVSSDLPVDEGTTYGASLKLDFAGHLPRSRTPWFWWRHTFYCQKSGPWDIGDFSFDTYQLNFSGDFRLFKHHKLRTCLHGGWLAGIAPPQEHFSLGGMTTLPGYPDDSFVGTRFVLATQSIFLSAKSLVQEPSIWHPLRFQVYFHAGTVWDVGERIDDDVLRMDVGFELDYMEVLRAGIVWPIGARTTESPRAYIGWGVHVL